MRCNGSVVAYILSLHYSAGAQLQHVSLIIYGVSTWESRIESALGISLIFQHKHDYPCFFLFIR